MTSEGRSTDGAPPFTGADIAELVGRAARRVTHRLVNDLAAVRLQAEAASRSNDRDAIVARLQGISGATASALALIRELHRLGDVTTRPRPFDLGVLATEMAPLLSVLSGIQDVLLDVPATAVVCESDPAELRRRLAGALLDRYSNGTMSNHSLALAVSSDGPSLVLRDRDEVVVDWSCST